MLTDLEFIFGESIYEFWILFEVIRTIKRFARATKKFVERKAPDWFCDDEWLYKFEKNKKENEESMSDVRKFDETKRKLV